MEIVTGHHWAATRIPDDSYAIAANQVAQDFIDFDDPKNYMWSDGLQEFVEEHHLNPHPETFNFRKIFGTDNEKIAITTRRVFGMVKNALRLTFCRIRSQATCRLSARPIVCFRLKIWNTCLHRIITKRSMIRWDTVRMRIN